MRFTKWMRIVTVLTCAWLCAASGLAQEAKREIVVISDLHLGMGKTPQGIWHPTEDFRWPHALRSFLDAISSRGKDAVDLVIAGDFVELWQPLDNMKCVQISAELGCTIDELVAVASIVAREHASELAALRTFASRGQNRVFIVPGNHDAALLIDTVWKQFAEPLGVNHERIRRVSSGVWSSEDGRIVVEHGHQIGTDVNGYAEWPKIVRLHEGKQYIPRSWGEQFVQTLFNTQEAVYPTIDNLSPESAGARYRMADRGLWGTATDMARFIAFNLFETSATQKFKVLGAPTEHDDPQTRWNIRMARDAGYRLFSTALKSGDPFRAELQANNAQSADLRQALDRLAKDTVEMPEADLRALCDLASASSKDGWKICRSAELGSFLESQLVPLRSVLSNHLTDRSKEHKSMSIFIYGHTHSMQARWELSLTNGARINVLNTGAFQRLMNEEGFLSRVPAGSSPSETLRLLSLDQLAPCYGLVTVSYAGRQPDAKAQLWWKPETGAEGKFLSFGDARCK
jgi:UDP-2,3-diacylglucosamine pyrophosphatase LpxH